MEKKSTMSSKEAGLAIGLAFGKYLFKTEDLHFGYWPQDLKLEVANMPLAQEKHSELIIANIPAGTKTILDVGCGSGALASRLIGRGYAVDCVSPSRVLTEAARKKVGDRCGFFETKYEDLKTDKKYDLVVFSESFQYIPVEKAIERSLKALNPGGHILICDFFATDAPGESPLHGGHNLARFYATMRGYPVRLVTDTDITKEAAPNLDLVDDMLRNLGQPVWNTILDFLRDRHPLLFKFAAWKYGKKIDKINLKYFSGQRNGANFAVYKSYRLLLFKQA